MLLALPRDVYGFLPLKVMIRWAASRGYVFKHVLSFYVTESSSRRIAA